MKLLQAVRGALALLAVFLWFVPGGIGLRGLVMPAVWLRPQRRIAWVSVYMKVMSRGILALLRLGGARFERGGRLPTEAQILVLMNHQSLLDILTVTLLASPVVPAFVTRSRYARFIPLVSPCIRLLGCPIVDPKRDARGALAAIEQAARAERTLLIFPEGHRSRDGEVQPFRPAGTLAVLRARRIPVYLVVTDGAWASRRLVDFVFNLYRVRGRSEVLGPFAPPEAEPELPAFVERMRGELLVRLERMRERGDEGR